ncbi:uncharacterized protein LOC144429880 isoform X1 [Styela clava]
MSPCSFINTLLSIAILFKTIYGEKCENILLNNIYSRKTLLAPEEDYTCTWNISSDIVSDNYAVAFTFDYAKMENIYGCKANLTLPGLKSSCKYTSGDCIIYVTKFTACNANELQVDQECRSKSIMQWTENPEIRFTQENKREGRFKINYIPFYCKQTQTTNDVKITSTGSYIGISPENFFETTKQHTEEQTKTNSALEINNTLTENIENSITLTTNEILNYTNATMAIHVSQSFEIQLFIVIAPSVLGLILLCLLIGCIIRRCRRKDENLSKLELTNVQHQDPSHHGSETLDKDQGCYENYTPTNDEVEYEVPRSVMQYENLRNDVQYENLTDNGQYENLRDNTDLYMVVTN